MNDVDQARLEALKRRRPGHGTPDDWNFLLSLLAVHDNKLEKVRAEQDNLLQQLKAWESNTWCPECCEVHICGEQGRFVVIKALLAARDKELEEARAEAEKWKITCDCHCTVLMDNEKEIAGLKEKLVQHIDSKGNSLCKQAFENLEAAHDDLKARNARLVEALEKIIQIATLYEADPFNEEIEKHELWQEWAKTGFPKSNFQHWLLTVKLQQALAGEEPTDLKEGK